MQQVFTSFCAFGASKGTTPLMDGSKFAKLTRDCKLLDKKLTNIDVDIIFSKVKAKTERKITFAQFKEACKLMAEKKFPGDADGYKKLEELITAGKGPAVTGATKAVNSDAVSRLTDTSKYTGSHKERFDESGKGKGLAGREELHAKSGYVGAYKEQGTYDKTH